jgi:hypothetical protein
MAGIDDLLNGLGGGVAVAVGAVVIAPVVAPALGRVMKPLIKNAIKGGIVLYGWGQESVAEMREYIEDTYAEAQAEMGKPAGAVTRGRPKSEGAAPAT